MSKDNLFNLDEVINKLEKEVPNKLVDEGIRVANNCFGDITTATKGSDNSFSISGTNAMVAEFGAGLTTDSTHEFASDMDFDVERGSYSKAHEGEYYKNNYKYWHYNGLVYTQKEPRRGMYFAMEYMKGNVAKIIKDVFR